MRYFDVTLYIFTSKVKGVIFPTDSLYVTLGVIKIHFTRNKVLNDSLMKEKYYHFIDLRPSGCCKGICLYLQ